MTTPANKVCQYLHKTLPSLPRYRAGFNPEHFPKNGLYFLFETGEYAHEGERIVRVGTHNGQNNLLKRLNEHLYTKNKDRSVFRKHIGRSLLSKRRDPFLEAWNIDLTKKEDRLKKAHLVDQKRLAEIEEEVSTYINQSFSFTLLRVDTEEQRISFEEGSIGAIAQCEVCKASEKWLGKNHPDHRIKNSGLWNIQKLKHAPIAYDEAARFLEEGILCRK